nr:RNA-directed DNA polymerase, eukaryota, reverse transcriptase zinc-binding domain protein [Tanacetum cinerariifolium]
MLKSKLADVELVIDKGNASEEVIYKHLEIVNSINELEKQQAMETAQKAKIKWRLKVMRIPNTTMEFLIKRNNLTIRAVLEAGKWIENPDLVKKEFLNHFKNRFGRPNKTMHVLITEFPHQLNFMQRMDMEADVTIEEIKNAVWDCGTDKSPGPGGFSFDFYRRFWSVIQKDVVAAVKCFFHYGSIPKGCNSSFIALIPKILDAKMVKDFRPISRIGSLYKIIAKILANRLVTVLGDVINEIQLAFVADRQILDSLFILNEVLHGNVVDAGMFKGIVLNSSMVLCHMFFADDAVFVGQWSNSNIDTIIYALKCFERASGLCMNMSKSKIMGIAVNGDKVDQVAHRIGCGILEVPFTYLGSKVGGCMSRIQNWNDVVENMSSRLSKWKMKTLSIEGRLTLINAVLEAMPIYHMSIIKVPLGVLKRMESIRCRVISAIHGTDGKIGTRTKSGYNSLLRDIVFEMEAVKDKGADLFSFMQKRLGDGVDKNISVADKLTHTTLAETFRREPRSDIEAVQLAKLEDQLEDVQLVNNRDRWAWSLNGSGEFSVASIRRLLDDIRLPDVSSQTRWIKAVPIKVNILAWRVILNGLPSRVNISRRDNFKKVCRWWNVDFAEVSSYDEWLLWISSLRIHGEFSVASIRRLFDDIRLSEVSSPTRWTKAVPIKRCRRMMSGYCGFQALGSMDRPSMESCLMMSCCVLFIGFDILLVNKRDMWAWSLNGSGEFSVASIRRLLDDIRLPDVSSQTRWIKAVPIKVNILAWKVRLNGLPSRVNISRRSIDINSILCPVCEREVESVSHVFSLAMLLKTILKRFVVGGMWISRRCRRMMSGYCGFQAL